jgi:glycine betaine/proline transport system substrate-binding protein
MAASIIKAHKLKTPILVYWWEPTWVMGKFDMVRLDAGYPRSDVRVGVNGRFKSSAPKLSKFLQRYQTDSDTVSEALAYMQDHDGATAEDAAVNFLKTQESIWTQWVPSDVAERVRQSL